MSRAPVPSLRPRLSALSKPASSSSLRRGKPDERTAPHPAASGHAPWRDPVCRRRREGASSLPQGGGACSDTGPRTPLAEASSEGEPSCWGVGRQRPRAHPFRVGLTEEARRRDVPSDYCGSLESKAELARRGAPSGRREGAERGGAGPAWGWSQCPREVRNQIQPPSRVPPPGNQNSVGKCLGESLGRSARGAPGVKWLTQSPRAPLGYEGEKCAPVAAHPFANLRVS